MIVPVLNEKTLKEVIQIVKPRREKCLYLYCNLMKYGVNEPNFKVFMHENSKSVFASYYGDSLHALTSEGDCGLAEEIVLERNPRTVFSAERLALKNYCEETTGLYKLHADCQINTEDIQQLGREDIDSLVDFLYSNSETYRRTYDKDNLRAQLLDRLDDGYCRYFGKYDNGNMVGCAFTKAELPDLMITGGVLVAQSYRKRGLGQKLCASMCNVANSENKLAYCFIDDENAASIKLHTSVGYRKVEKVYKYTIQINET